MEGKSSDWRPGPTVCRCCLSEGCYKDISTEYFWMGRREVYSEMLSETLDLSIAYSNSNGPNSNSRLICEQCISRLRDASEFKRQVIDCEKTFMQHLNPGSSSKSGDFLAESISDVKVEAVKHEKESFTDDDFDDRPDFLDVDSDDDLDNQPLTKLASKIPKKEAIDILELLDTSQITVKRKSNLKTKEPPKKILKKKETKAAPRTVSKAAPKQADKKKDLNPWGSDTRKNTRIIIEYATVYPFRLPGRLMKCIVCSETFSEAALFRRHMDKEHVNFYKNRNLGNIWHATIGQLVKVDITDLSCRICSLPFDDLDEIAAHLNTEHYKNIDFQRGLGLQPYRLEDLNFVCVICQHKTPSLVLLSRHTAEHYRNSICEHCGKAYATKESLQQHVRDSCSKDGQVRCRKCRKVISSRQEHLEESYLCNQYICSVCKLRFPSAVRKQNHMESVHLIPKKKFPCPECKMNFKKSYHLTKHFSIVHTENCLTCFCGLKFVNQKELDDHIPKHTKERAFVCAVCDRSYTRKKCLQQHMWVHKEKRFTCNICKKSYTQKVCFKAHMKSHHPELDDLNE